MARSRGYTKKQTGSPSRYGGAAGGSVRRVLNPWGNTVPAAQGRKANAYGVGVARPKPRGTAVRRPTPDASLWSINYPNNDPLQWPIEGGKRGSPTGMTQAKADWNNAVVNNAYKRAGYPEP